MIILILFAFLAGIVTVLSPCILPVLPIVLSGSIEDGKKRPLGIVTGFILSFTFFTLFLTSIVKISNISADSIRGFSIFIILFLGISLLIPKIQKLLEKLFVSLSRFSPKSQGKEGFGGGFILGLSIGLIWTPCVGPILASVISLALTGSVNGSAFFITFAYSLGTSIPMLAIVYGGRNLLNKVPWLVANTGKIQKAFGVLMIVTAVAIYFNFDRNFQTYILNKFPNYGTGLTKFEESNIVQDQLDSLKGGDSNKDMGKTILNLLDKTTSAPEIVPGGEWFNLPSDKNNLTIKDLKGKVVLVDFWTYTCINCIRTLPYIEKWYETYKDDNFVIIGVHTPEFEFEKSAENVKKAIGDFGLTYPIVQDNNYATWNAYSNHYWPAKYLIDKDGKIRYTHSGEGDYDETEKVIQELISETGKEADIQIKNSTYQIQTKTPELYLGYGRIGYFATPSQLKSDREYNYTLPTDLALHHFAFSGKWKIESEKSQAFTNSNLVLAFEAKDVYLVMKPKSDNPGKVKVYLDDNEVNESNHGDDAKDAVVTVDKDRLYKLIHLSKSEQHVLKLEFLDDNVEVYAFTFG